VVEEAKAVEDLLLGLRGLGPDLAWPTPAASVAAAERAEAGRAAAEPGESAPLWPEAAALGQDTVLGTSGNDSLHDGGDANVMYGFTGDDQLFGNGGADTLFGGDGLDRLFGGGGPDTLFGRSGNDTLQGGTGSDRLNGEIGDDTIIADQGSDSAFGGPGQDTVLDDTAVAGTMAFFGGADRDRYVITDGGGLGQTWTVAPAGIAPAGPPGTQWRIAAGGTLQGGGNAVESVTLQAGSGADRLTTPGFATAAGLEEIVFAGGEGDDSVDAAGLFLDIALTADGGAGSDTLFGHSGFDLLQGGGGTDTLLGRAGDDRLVGGPGLAVDTLIGGFGQDIADYSEADDDIVVNLGDALPESGSDAAGDLLTQIEIVIAGIGSDTLLGNAAANTLFGGFGADELSAADAGGDSLFGGLDADTFVAGDDGAGDHFDGGSGGSSPAEPLDLVSYAAVLGPVAASLQSGLGLGGAAAGDSYADIEWLLGTAADDTLIGAAGTFGQIDGGAGNDTLVYNGGTDLFGGDGDDRVFATQLSSVGLFGGTGLDSLVASEAADSYDLAQLLPGGNGFEQVRLLGGDDSLAGAPDASASFPLTLFGGSGNDVMRMAAAVQDRLFGDEGNDSLEGGGARNLLFGGDGDDLLRGGVNLVADTLVGGAGQDTATYLLSASRVTVDLSDEQTEFGAEALDDFLTQIEIVIGSVHNDTLRGGAGDNTLFGASGHDRLLADGNGSDTLFGGSGDDSLAGAGGADRFFGGAGFDTLFDGLDAMPDLYDGGTEIGALSKNDIVSYAGASDAVTVDLLLGVGLAGAAAGDLYSNLEGVVGGAGNDTLISGSGLSEISGAGGNDTLVANGNIFGGGGDGDDVLFFNTEFLPAFEGNGGQDTLVGREIADRLDLAGFGNGNRGIEVLLLRGGDDTLTGPATQATAATLTLFGGDGADSLLLSASAVDSLFGGDGTDWLQGGAFANLLDGGAGNDLLRGGTGMAADRLVGGAGQDAADYSASSAVTIDMSDALAESGGEAAGDLLTQIEILLGSQQGDTLTAQAGGAANSFYGGDGNDTLDGRQGGDLLDGGGGGDWVSYLTSQAVSLDLAAGLATGGQAAGDGLVSVENVLGSAGDDRVAGDSGANALLGLAGNDVLAGGLGADSLFGGDNDDTLFFDATDATVSGDAGDDTLIATDGTDLVQLQQGPFNLGLASIESFRLGAGDDWFNGTSSAAAYAALEGPGMTVFGGSGRDQISMRGVEEPAAGGSGDDYVDGGSGNDVLWGGWGADRLIGGAGNDQLYGGPGEGDSLYGGAGFDTYYVGRAEGQDFLFDDPNGGGLVVFWGFELLEPGGIYDGVSGPEVELFYGGGLVTLNLLDSEDAINGLPDPAIQNSVVFEAGDLTAIQLWDYANGNAGNSTSQPGAPHDVWQASWNGTAFDSFVLIVDS